MLKTFFATCLAAFISVSAMAQAPATPPTTAKTVTAPRPTLPAGTKVNLNTASASELDALPSVGKARAKAIVDERAKSPFKDWADFDKRMQHTSVNRGVRAKIKDSVTF
jgi:DNA uptake protein ComE-like DNA-binding protein